MRESLHRFESVTDVQMTPDTHMAYDYSLAPDHASRNLPGTVTWVQEGEIASASYRRGNMSKRGSSPQSTHAKEASYTAVRHARELDRECKQHVASETRFRQRQAAAAIRAQRQGELDFARQTRQHTIDMAREARHRARVARRGTGLDISSSSTSPAYSRPLQSQDGCQHTTLSSQRVHSMSPRQ
jgi:hypothetical protein